MRTFLILETLVNVGAAIYPSEFRPLHIAAVVLSLAVLALTAWLDRRERRWCEYCSGDGECCVCK